MHAWVQEINVDQCKKWFEKNLLSSVMGFHFIHSEGKYYMAAINQRVDTLFYINLFDSSVKFISLRNVVPTGVPYLIKISDNYLHMIDVKRHIYFGIKIDSDFIPRPQWKVDLEHFVDFKDKYLNPNFSSDDYLEFIGSKLVIPYGVYGRKTFTEKQTPFMYFDTITKKVSYGFSYPPEMRCRTFQGILVNIKKISDSSLLAVYPKINSIVQFNIKTNTVELRNNSFEFQSHFICFNRDFETVLSYVSKYDLNDEENTRVIVSNEGYYVVKRLRKINKTDFLKCAILKFDKNLNHTGTYLPNELVSPRLSFAYKNGVAIFNENLDKLYYYDFK